MKTVELPEALVNGIQQRALQQGRAVADVVAERLSPSGEPSASPGETELVAKTLPKIKIRPVQPPDRKLTAEEFSDWLKQADLQLDVERARGLSCGLCDRPRRRDGHLRSRLPVLSAIRPEPSSSEPAFNESDVNWPSRNGT